MCDEKTAPRGRAIIQGVQYETCGGCGKPIRGTGKTVGGHAIFVTKDFIRKGQRVPFSDQWQALCESVGFRMVCRHRAMLVKSHGTQGTIFGGTEQLSTQRKSFFRRLAEKKGSPAIDWEDVLCMVRLEGNA